MAKRVSSCPDWLQSDNIIDVYSVSSHVSEDFAEFIDYWKHNGYWFFDSPEIIARLANENEIDIRNTHLFYYEVYEKEFEEIQSLWSEFEPEETFKTDVVIPVRKSLEGYDVVSFSMGNAAECSPLSCNALARDLKLNEHCLIESLEYALQLLESGIFMHTEPGPFRVIAVYSVEWP